jgi:hypothetical protein
MRKLLNLSVPLLLVANLGFQFPTPRFLIIFPATEILQKVQDSTYEAEGKRLN